MSGCPGELRDSPPRKCEAIEGQGASSGVSTAELSRAMPALLTRASTFPCSATIASAVLVTAVGSVTSRTAHAALTPVSARRLTAASSALRSRPARTTFAPHDPSATADSKPMPRAAPGNDRDRSRQIEGVPVVHSQFLKHSPGTPAGACGPRRPATAANCCAPSSLYQAQNGGLWRSQFCTEAAHPARFERVLSAFGGQISVMRQGSPTFSCVGYFV
jgi:hypothetical protein